MPSLWSRRTSTVVLLVMRPTLTVIERHLELPLTFDERLQRAFTNLHHSSRPPNLSIFVCSCLGCTCASPKRVPTDCDVAELDPTHPWLRGSVC